MKRTMDLNRLTTFVKVVEEGSFTRAAVALDLPKSSVSRAITLLEDELGVRLLQRTSRKVVVTEAGAQYHAEVTRALANIEEATASLAEERVEPRGVVRITAPVDATNDLFVPILARFLELHPGITLDVDFSGSVRDLLQDGFDLGIRAGIVKDDSLVARRIGTVQIGLFASPAYVARRGAPESVKALADHDCIGIIPHARGRSTWHLTRGDVNEKVDVTGPLAVNEMSAVRSATIVGVGIGLVPSFAVAMDVARGDLVRVLPEWLGPTSFVNLVYPSARFVPQRVVLVREFLLKELARIPWGCTEVPKALLDEFDAKRPPRLGDRLRANATNGTNGKRPASKSPARSRA
ncbi:MAG: LysR family transcriptional regulator [Polyangiaceae bacterium]